VEVKVSLRSDFYDYYDHWFDLEGIEPCFVFERFSYAGPGRREMLEYLQSLGLRVPAFGRVCDLYSYKQQEYEKVKVAFCFDTAVSVVAYSYEKALRGEGKVLLS